MKENASVVMTLRDLEHCNQTWMILVRRMAVLKHIYVSTREMSSIHNRHSLLTVW